MALLSAFNPHDMSEYTVRIVATGRDHALREIVDAVRSNLRAPTMQHLIVSAPRGYGKSFLMRHLQFEVARVAREEDLPLAVVLMPEEMPHVREPETLVRELTRALSGGAASEAELTWHEDDGAAWDGAVDELGAAARDRVGPDGLVVALVENFDVLLRRAFPKDLQASRLRSLLSDRDSRLMIVAASATGAFDRDYDDRLFHAFHEIALEPWSIEDCMSFFDRQRIEAGEMPLDAAARARGRAVASFIGGTPRLATLLGDALFDDDVLHAADLLQRLVDELTPYYKERIEALPSRSQKLLDALLRGGEPATPSEVARRVQARSQAAIAGPFSELVRERIVVGERAPGSAEVLYRVADRVFAHYYRRRILDHGAPTCALEALVELLAQFFTSEQKRSKVVEFARLGLMQEARLMARLARVERGGGAGKRWLLSNLARHIPRWLIPIASDAIGCELKTVVDAARRGDIDRASAIVDRSINTTTQSDRAVILLVRATLDYCEGIDTGLAAAEEAFALTKRLKNPILHLEVILTLGWHLNHAKQPELALSYATEAKLKSIQLDRKDYQSRSLRHVAYSMDDLKRHKEAAATARQAADLAHEANDRDEEAMSFRHLAFSLGSVGNHNEAIIAARQAADLAQAAGDGLGKAMCLLHSAFSLGNLGRREDALATARQAADLARAAEDKFVEAQCLRQAAFSLGGLERHDEAIATAQQAANLARAAGESREEAECLRHAAFSLSQMHHYEEAITMARQAVYVAHAADERGEEAECLRHAAVNLGELGRHNEAIMAARESAMLAKVSGNMWSEKHALLLLGREFNALGRHGEALNTIAEAATLLEEVPDDDDIRTLITNTRNIARSAIRSMLTTPNLDPLHTLLTAAGKDFIGHGLQAQCLSSFLDALIESAVLNVEVAGKLEAWAIAIDLHFPKRFTVGTGQLRNAARYHASGRSRTALVRLDPDFAHTLRTLFPTVDGAQVKDRNTSIRRKR